MAFIIRGVWTAVDLNSLMLTGSLLLSKVIFFSGFYINDITAGSTQVNATPVILKQSAASAWVDGCNALGATVGHFCVDLAMNKAREAGIAIVTAQREFHFLYKF